MTLEVLLSSTREFSDHPLIFVIFNNKTSVLVTFFKEKINDDLSYWWVNAEILNIPFYLAFYVVLNATIELQNSEVNDYRELKF